VIDRFSDHTVSSLVLLGLFQGSEQQHIKYLKEARYMRRGGNNKNAMSNRLLNVSSEQWTEPSLQNKVIGLPVQPMIL
jgi:hypothetical protein